MDINEFLDAFHKTGLVSMGIKLLAAIAILIVGMKLVDFLMKLVKKANKLGKVDAGVRSFIGSFTSIVLKITVAVTAISVLGVPMTSFVTLLGTAGLTVGLALQGGLSNIAGGLTILLFKPFDIGDFITFDGKSGTVSEINIFYTKVVTPDNKVVVFPNGTIANGETVNYSENADRRVDLTFTASYDAEPDRVISVLLDTAHENGAVYTAPEPFAAVSAHGDSAVEYTLRVWCKKDDYWMVYHALMKAVKENFDKNGIEIPYPQIDVHTK